MARSNACAARARSPANASAAPFGPEAWETLRVEAGTPRFGVDIDDATIPNDAVEDAAIAYGKGCYPGQEIVVRIRSRGFPARRLLVIGHRVRREDSLIKRLASRIANAVRQRMLRDQTPDTGCGLKVFARSTFLSLPYFDHMHRFLPALIRRAGGEVVSVPVRHRAREAGRSKYGTLDRLWVGIVDLIGVIWLQRRPVAPIVAEKEE